MYKLPSFTVLFILSTLSYVLFMVATFWSFNSPGDSSNPLLHQVKEGLRLLGLGIVVIAPFIMLLKFFRRLDQKS